MRERESFFLVHTYTSSSSHITAIHTFMKIQVISPSARSMKICLHLGSGATKNCTTGRTQKEKGVAVEAQSSPPAVSKKKSGEEKATNEKSSPRIFDATPLWVKQAKLRQFTVQEIIASETTYRDNLEQLIACFRKYLREEKYKKKGAPSKDLVDDAVKQIDQIWGISKSLLASLIATKRDDEHCMVGRVFAAYVHFFKMYTAFITRFETYMQAFQTFSCCEKWKHKMTSLMILPVQRLPRYRMLLSKVLEYTPVDANHPDREHVLKALQGISTTNDGVNKDVESDDQKIEYEKHFWNRFCRSKVKHLGEKFDDLRNLDPDKRMLACGFFDKVKPSTGAVSPKEFFLLEGHFCFSAKGSDRLSYAIPLRRMTATTAIPSSLFAFFSIRGDAECSLYFKIAAPFPSFVAVFASKKRRDRVLESIRWQTMSRRSYSLSSLSPRPNTPSASSSFNSLPSVNSEQSIDTASCSSASLVSPTLPEDEDETAQSAMFATAATYLRDIEEKSLKTRYEFVKAFLRSRYGYKSVHKGNKKRLKGLCVATLRERESGCMWKLATRLFADGPPSNGKDRRYEQIKASIRQAYGKTAINAQNKHILKAIATYSSFSKRTDAEPNHPMWKYAETNFARFLPPSNGSDARYERVKSQIRFKWGEAAINKRNKQILKALAVASPCMFSAGTA